MGERPAKQTTMVRVTVVKTADMAKGRGVNSRPGKRIKESFAQKQLPELCPSAPRPLGIYHTES